MERTVDVQRHMLSSSHDSRTRFCLRPENEEAKGAHNLHRRDLDNFRSHVAPRVAAFQATLHKLSCVHGTKVFRSHTLRTELFYVDC